MYNKKGSMMNTTKKLTTSFVFSFVSLTVYAESISFKTVEGTKALDGFYSIQVDKKNHTWATKDGSLTSKSLWEEKKLDKNKQSYTYKAEQMISKNKDTYRVYFLGKQRSKKENGYAEIYKNNKVVAKALYKYNK
jgi:hypothetical protein